LVFGQDAWHTMLGHVWSTGDEVCGMLLGVNRVATEAVAIDNVAAYPGGLYVMDPSQQIATFLRAEEQALEVVAFYHSHPFSAPIPSGIDVGDASYPATPYVIVGQVGRRGTTGWQARAWELPQAREIPIAVCLHHGEIPHDAIVPAGREAARLLVARVDVVEETAARLLDTTPPPAAAPGRDV
jgi:proteasome lid subunit RPN8/RPN11